MEQDITFKIIFVCVLLFLSGLFSGSEASLFSLTELHLYKMKEDKNLFYPYISRLLSYPRRLLTTVLVGNESVNITISALTTSIFIVFFGIEGKWVSIAVTTVTLLIVGEAIPKTFAVNYPIRFSNTVSIPLTFFAAIARPVVWGLEKISDLFVYIFGRAIVAEGTTLTEDEFKALVDVGHEEGALEESQKALIHRVFKLADTPVSDIMTPRVDMFCLPVSMSIEQMVQEVLEARYSRIPIYRTDKDDIVGVLHTRDLLEEISNGRMEGKTGHLLRKPYFVPLERSVDSILRDFKGRRTQMAFVVDEYGGIEGLVTVSDVMESIVEDIYDEDDGQKKPYQKISDGSLMISGAMDIEEFNELAGTAVSLEEFDTLGGFVFHLFGKLPLRGDAVDFGDITFKVERVSKTRIMKVRMKRKEGPDRE
ncbi:MAG: HlyC/CorC family transporter [Deltaproteobacteria bacterium]|nr:HlyC/CorC family transporter [Deltaproteobacteria bacterium]